MTGIGELYFLISGSDRKSKTVKIPSEINFRAPWVVSEFNYMSNNWKKEVPSSVMLESSAER